MQKYEDVSVKEEPSDEGNEDPDLSVDVDEDLEEDLTLGQDITLSQALELFDRVSFPQTNLDHILNLDNIPGATFEKAKSRRAIWRTLSVSTV